MASLADHAHLVAAHLAAPLGMEQVDALIAHASLDELPAGAILLRDQAPVDALYLILEGRVALSVEVAGHAIHLGDMAAGNWIGELAYFCGSHLAASTVIAATDLRLMRLTHAAFDELAVAQPVAACRLTHVLVTMLIHRLRATVQDPVLDADGELLMLGDLSLPAPVRRAHEPGVREFLRRLLGLT